MEGRFARILKPIHRMQAIISFLEVEPHAFRLYKKTGRYDENQTAHG